MYIRLFDSVKICDGIKKSIIFDTTTGFLNYIPKSFSSLLSNRFNDYSSLLKDLDHESKKILHEYIDFIIKNKLGFILKNRDEISSFIDSAELNFSSTEVDYLIFDIIPSNLAFDIITQINDLQIKYVQLRVSGNWNITEIYELFLKLEFFNSTSVHEVAVVLPYEADIEDMIIKGECIKSNKFLHFTLHSCDHDQSKVYGNIEILKTKYKIQIPASCGCINLRNLQTNRSFYFDSKNHNSCLYKKIGIDHKGNIKNCPSMLQSYGNVKKTSLRDALYSNDFKKYWDITKDKIDVCKNCEFRYLCTDCRAYTEKGLSDYEIVDISKPLKCGYNPYTGVWEDWTKNPLKQDAINFYGLQELKKIIN